MWRGIARTPALILSGMLAACMTQDPDRPYYDPGPMFAAEAPPQASGATARPWDERRVERGRETR